MALKIPAIEPFWKNPVVVRDMRVNLRGPRAFWNQAVYLALLIILALGGYATSTAMRGLTGDDPVTVQRSLQQFYYFIFETLATLITLIAPALTAVTIINERQRMTLDLLVTTPMSSRTMLVGKLMSSVAFLGLLLFLSIPASALCVILGGSTIVDVFRVYVLLATDGFVLAAIGLTFSCSARTSIQAIIGTYAAVAMFDIFSAGSSALGARSIAMSIMGHGAASAAPAILAIGVLNPFVAVTVPSMSVNIFGAAIPLWIATPTVAFMLVWLLITAASLRIGMYGGGLIASLRRQVLLVTLVVSYLVAQSMDSLFGSFGAYGGAGGGTGADEMYAFGIFLMCAFGASLFFLPGLFVPVTDPDLPPGEVAVKGWYAPLKSFGPEHAGALPYFHIWLITFVVGAVAGMYDRVAADTTFLAAIPPGLFYVSGVGFLLWGISRRAAEFSTSEATAKPMAFLILLFWAAWPACAAGIWADANHADGFDPFKTWLGQVWLLYPFTTISETTPNWGSFLWSGGLAYVLGAVASAFWRPIRPGAFAIFRKRPTAPIPAVSGYVMAGMQAQALKDREAQPVGAPEDKADGDTD